MTITLSGRLICANEDEARIVRDHMPEHIRLTRNEPGCLRFDVEETSDPLVWQVDEAFASQADFDAHQVRMKDSAWGKASVGIARDFKITKGLSTPRFPSPPSRKFSKNRPVSSWNSFCHGN